MTCTLPESPGPRERSAQPSPVPRMIVPRTPLACPSLFRWRPSMGRKLYVGNLTFETTASELESLFGQFGTVQSAQVISDRDTGRSKGFGFVEMGTDQEAQAAIAGLSGKQMGGRSLTVNEAKPKEDRGGGGGGRGGYGGGGGGGGRGGYGGGGGRY